jgi:alginate O-acetyltransferase complex protein AlgI
MVFSSTVFLFLFLPAVIAAHFIAPVRWRNAILVAASLLFYGWGEPGFLPVVALSVALNFCFAQLIERAAGQGRRRGILILAATLNIGLLVVFKYAGFLADSANSLEHWLAPRAAPLPALPAIALPLGISFFTFHALSYLIDIYRREAPAQRSLSLLALYVLFFPQLVAGPIVRYHEIADQLPSRQVALADFSAGVERFIVGLAKKMLIANIVGEVADAILNQPASDLTARVAWLGIVAYALQIYFDFSGYSDMAVGLARLFGFRFPENFDYPYSARSITEFWRRWHMSLSRWFRDYLYIPLGGNRVSPLRVYRNLIVVFLICGLWHGASWNFVIWGLFHGAFLALERMGLSRVLEKLWSPVRRIYCLAVVLCLWVFFRLPTFSGAVDFLHAMVRIGTPHAAATTPPFVIGKVRWLALAAGLIGSAPWLPWIREVWSRANVRSRLLVGPAKIAALTALALGVAMRLSSGTYNPFIYFRF